MLSETGMVQAMYIATSREAKRLESIMQSPIFSTLSETLQAGPASRSTASSASSSADQPSC